VLLAALGLLSLAWPLGPATQLYPWRLAPLLVLLTQVYLARAFLRLLAGRPYDGLVRPTWLRLLCLTAGSGVLFLYHYRFARENHLLILGGILLAITLALGLARHLGRGRSLSAASCARLVAALFALAAWPALSEFGERSSLLMARPAAETTLYAWAADTDPESVFLIPPQLDDFRLQSRRAVVVDWKSTPLVPGEIEEWYERITAVSGGLPPRSPDEAARGYAGLTAEVFRRLAVQFGASYVVSERSQAGLPDEWPVVFQNERFQVRSRPPRTSKPAATPPGAERFHPAAGGNQ
jgi:hypothetical protein